MPGVLHAAEARQVWPTDYSSLADGDNSGDGDGDDGGNGDGDETHDNAGRMENAPKQANSPAMSLGIKKRQYRERKVTDAVQKP